MREWRYYNTMLNLGTGITPEEAALGAHCAGCWVSIMADLEVVEGITISCSYREFNYESSNIQPVV
jgi:hypothetical protein